MHWRLAVIGPALRAVGADRSKAINCICAASFTDLKDRASTVSEKSVRRWIAAYEENGLAGLRRKDRADRGSRRVVLTRTWGDDCGLSTDAKQQIAVALARYIRSLWRSGVPGWTHAQRMASARLQKLTREAGCTLSDATLRSLCHVPRNLVEEGRSYQLVAIQEQDNKQFFDRHVPRIRRHRDGIAPMDVVIADVHHFDIQVRRPDGSTATPKAISWLDLATNRIFITPLLLDKGRGVRREDVAESFIAMATDSGWGLPRSLYCDNGGEYGWTDFVQDVMKLADLNVGYLNDAPQLASQVARTRATVLRARPYNAPAKPIEGIFGMLEGGVLRMLPGWIGGNRMRKKTQNVGHEPAPFAGDFEEFKTKLRAALDYFETHRQFGHLKGKSPRQTFAAAEAAGWKRIDISGDALAALFFREELRKVDQGAFTLDGRVYAHDALLPLTGTTIRLHVPLVGDKERITVLGDDGTPICVVSPDVAFAFLDRAGAQEQNRRMRALNVATASRRRDADKLDLLNEMQAAAALDAPAPHAPSGGVVRVGDELHAVAEAKRALPAREKSTLGRDHARQIEVFAKLEAAALKKAAG